MYIRSHSWGRGDLSWSRVMERLLSASDKLGHSSVFISTNGYEGMERWTEQLSTDMLARHQKEMAGRPYDIDITYTIPMNFPARFAQSSKVKIGRYDYESSELPKVIAKHINVPDYIVGSSDFVLDIFARAGADLKKLRKIPSGVDPNIFSPVGSKLNLKKMGFDDPFVFLCIAEPHYRKQIDKLIETYCERFTSSDNVLLLIKTKFLGNNPQLFEMDIRPHLAAAKNKYGDRMPAIRVLSGFIKDVAPLYRSADAFVLPTAGEGWGMPFLEAMACGNIVIAPEYGGQLEFLNNKNSLLVPVDIVPALPQEQYGAPINSSGVDPVGLKGSPNGLVGRPRLSDYGDAMLYAYKNHDQIKKELSTEMNTTAAHYSWEFAAKKMLELA